MGNCAGRDDDMDPEQRARSKEIDKRLASDGKLFAEEIKILLLGPGESGKSTVFKQLQILQETDDAGFSDADRQSWKPIVFSNVISQMRVLIEASKELNIELGSAVQPLAEKIYGLTPTAIGTVDVWNSETISALEKLWKDTGIKKVYSLRDKHFQLNDSAQYFFDNINRFAADNYVPTDEDILRSRVRTTGIDEAVFTFDRYHYKITDVGGQRNERRKWIHCFDSVTAVLFCASLSGYDQVLREDHKQNRLKEALLLFDEMVNSPWFTNISFILFLNKLDLFEEKLPRVPLSTCFKDYNGGSNLESAKAHIRKKFEERKSSNGDLFPHFTVAISTDNVKMIWRAVREIVLKTLIGTIFC